MESIIGLCKRRGFIFASSEIYGGYNGFFDYGPLGVELRNNIKNICERHGAKKGRYCWARLFNHYAPKIFGKRRSC